MDAHSSMAPDPTSDVLEMTLSNPKIPSTAQHFLECGLEDCERNCEFFCNTCHQNMCKQCKKEHLRSPEAKNHEVVLYPLRERQIPGTTGISKNIVSEDSRTRREAENTDIKISTSQSPKSINSIPGSEEREDIIYETFYHKSGKEFQCMYMDGMRLYLDDWGSKDWQPFPKRWYNEGLLITNSLVKDQENEKSRRQQQQQQSSGAEASGSRQHQPGYKQQSSSGQDDREGVLNHPKMGRIPTYIFQKTQHPVHCFYDHTQGQWMRLPIGWELHHEMVGKLVDQVEEALPTWGDRQDILALLRQCNYDPDECMSTYLHLEGDPWLKAPKTQQKSKAAEKKMRRSNNSDSS